MSIVCSLGNFRKNTSFLSSFQMRGGKSEYSILADVFPFDLTALKIKPEPLAFQIKGFAF